MSSSIRCRNGDTGRQSFPKVTSNRNFSPAVWLPSVEALTWRCFSRRR